VLAELDNLLKDTEIPYRDGRLAWKQNDNEVIRMQGPDGIFSPFAEDFDGGNFILKSDVIWNATGIIICGIIFRSEADQRLGAQYQFLFLRFSGAPAWAIEYHKFGDFRNSLTGVKYSSAVDLKNNATNQVVIVAMNETFTVYINGVRQGKYFDNSKQREDGVLAFLGMQDSGDGSCTYENTTIWELK